MSDSTSISSIRKRILSRTGKPPAPATKKMVVPASLPDAFYKTKAMKMLEYKYGIRLESVILDLSLTELESRFPEMERSTFSKWRKYFRIKLGESESE